MEKRYRDAIYSEFYNCVKNTISRLECEETYRPFHAALLSDDALFWSRFERSFSTSFGQRVIEEISKIVTIANGASDAKRQKETIVKIDSSIDDAINLHLKSLRTGKATNRWKQTLSAIARTKRSGRVVEQRILSDLWWVRSGVKHYMSIKTVKPNIDQAAVAKGDLLRLTIADPSCKAYFGLYYNPYGEKRASYAHYPPMGIFDFHNDEVVLIGKDYWDTLGGNGCYNSILRIAKKVGTETKRILEEMRED